MMMIMVMKMVIEMNDDDDYVDTNITNNSEE